MPMHRFNSLKRWGMTGLVGMMALTLATCGRIPQDGSPSNAAGKNFYISGFGTAGGDECPPTTYLGGMETSLSTSDGYSNIWAIINNDSTEKTTATEPENQVILLSNIHVEYEVLGATMQLPTYDFPVGGSVGPGGDLSCSVFTVFSQGAKDYINKNRSAFPTNPTSANYFQVKAKVQAQGYETNGGKSVVTPSAYFSIYVFN